MALLHCFVIRIESIVDIENLLRFSENIQRRSSSALKRTGDRKKCSTYMVSVARERLQNFHIVFDISVFFTREVLFYLFFVTKKKYKNGNM